MPENHLKWFFIYIVFPSILAIGFFVLLIFSVILPSFENNRMEGKKEMLAELTNTTLSLLDEYYQEVLEQAIQEDSARILAAKRIELVRYGAENKDYFWIIDKQPKMVMHPYRPELINADLSNYQDPKGKKLFVEATKTVATEGDGYINYMWQWKDDSTRIVPKLSYVKEFAPWGWIVGTGIYLEDVRAELKILKNRLLLITLLFTLLLAVILLFIIRQSLGIENKRRSAEMKLQLSRTKYKSLVEASTEGTLMLLKDEIIFSNIKFSKLCGHDTLELKSLHFEDLFSTKWQTILELIVDPKSSVAKETKLKTKEGVWKEVLISVSVISYAMEKGYIIIVKEVSEHDQLEKYSQTLAEELQSSLLLMHRDIKTLIRAPLFIPSDQTLREAAKKMYDSKSELIFISSGEDIIGVINSNDLARRALAEGFSPDSLVTAIMSSPAMTVSENALLFEVSAQMQKHQISHLGVLDEKGKVQGVVGLKDIVLMELNMISSLIAEIQDSRDVNELAILYKRVSVLVKALFECGSRTEHINRMISAIADAMHIRVIEFGIAELGPLPCNFAFMVMGSEGRREQTLATDQDNAIILENKSDQESRKYFLQLAERVNKDLATIGYRYCEGEIMAKNPKWTQPLEKWKSYFSHWINTSNPQDILEAGIFFDFRFIFGDFSLVSELRDHINEVSENKSIFFYHMAQEALKFKSPLNVFGNIIGNESKEDESLLNLKKVMLPILTFIRLYSIKAKLLQTNNMERLDGLLERGSIDKNSYEELKRAFNILMSMRLKLQSEQIWRNEPVNNSLNLMRLSKNELSVLKKIFNEISSIQSKMSFDFKGGE